MLPVSLHVLIFFDDQDHTVISYRYDMNQKYLEELW